MKPTLDFMMTLRCFHLAWLGLAWLGSARLGSARLAIIMSMW
jgi:hypothetical protein